jgi:hypothetical protein
MLYALSVVIALFVVHQTLEHQRPSSRVARART